MAKWMGKAKARMEARGTTGWLRSQAKAKGLLSGDKDVLTESDLSALEAAAKKQKGPDGKLTKAGLRLLRATMQARNMMKAKK